MCSTTKATQPGHSPTLVTARAPFAQRRRHCVGQYAQAQAAKPAGMTRGVPTASAGRRDSKPCSSRPCPLQPASTLPGSQTPLLSSTTCEIHAPGAAAEPQRPSPVLTPQESPPRLKPPAPFRCSAKAQRRALGLRPAGPAAARRPRPRAPAPPRVRRGSAAAPRWPGASRSCPARRPWPAARRARRAQPRPSAATRPPPPPRTPAHAAGPASAAERPLRMLVGLHQRRGIGRPSFAPHPHRLVPAK